jgi:hypothetical protein
MNVHSPVVKPLPTALFSTPTRQIDPNATAVVQFSSRLPQFRISDARDYGEQHQKFMGAEPREPGSNDVAHVYPVGNGTKIVVPSRSISRSNCVAMKIHDASWASRNATGSVRPHAPPS